MLLYPLYNDDKLQKLITKWSMESITH